MCPALDCATCQRLTDTDRGQHCDHYLARRLRHLDNDELAELDARQQAILDNPLDNPPAFDPAKLQRARRRLNATRTAAAPRSVLLSSE